MPDKSFNARCTFFCECGWVGHTQPGVRLRALRAPQRAPVLRKHHIWLDRTTRRLAAFTTATILLLELYPCEDRWKAKCYMVDAWFSNSLIIRVKEAVCIHKMILGFTMLDQFIHMGCVYNIALKHSQMHCLNLMLKAELIDTVLFCIATTSSFLKEHFPCHECTRIHTELVNIYVDIKGT